MPMSSCPPSIALEQFLLGRLQDVDSELMESHLSTCADCQRQLTTLVAEDEFVVALRKHSSQSDALNQSDVGAMHGDLVNLLIPHLKQIATDLEETTTFAGAPTTHDADIDCRLVHRHQSIDTFAPYQLGRYEIRGILGHGGMGTVLQAYDPVLKRLNAIKVIHSKLIADPAMASRFVRESQAAAAVEHDNIVAVYAVEMHQGTPCIVMPLLRGKTLKQHLAENVGPLSLTEILRISRESASGLAAAHAVGLIHCDIKPANLWLETPNDRVKILDFGLAIGHEDPHTDAQFISGTPGYLSPEQARGLPLDQRTDIFSLGCVLYRMATGTEPFTGERRLRALWTVLSDTPTPAIALNRSIPAEISDLIDRMLARDPDQRPATATIVLESIQAWEDRIAAQRQKTVRRRWLLALVAVSLISGSGVSVWSTLLSPSAPQAVKTTFIGDSSPIPIIIRRDGQEQTLTLGSEKTLDLLPGDYTIGTTIDQPGRTLVPDRFTVESDRPQTLRIALVGEVATQAIHTQPITTIAVSSTNNTIIYSAGLDRVVAAWDPSSTAASKLVDVPYAVRCIALSPNGDYLATAGGNKQLPAELEIGIWETKNLKPWHESLSGHSRLITAIAYSPDGRQLASAGADGVFLWDLNQRTSRPLEQAELGTVSSIAFSSDRASLLAGDDQGQVTLWDLKTRTAILTKNASDSAVRVVAFLSDRWVAAGDDTIIRIWKQGALEQEFLGHTHAVTALVVSPDEKHVISSDSNGKIHIWSVSRGQSVYSLKASNGAVTTIATISNGRQLVTGGNDGVIRLWQLPFCD